MFWELFLVKCLQNIREAIAYASTSSAARARKWVWRMIWLRICHPCPIFDYCCYLFSLSLSLLQTLSRKHTHIFAVYFFVVSTIQLLQYMQNKNRKTELICFQEALHEYWRNIKHSLSLSLFLESSLNYFLPSFFLMIKTPTQNLAE